MSTTAPRRVLITDDFMPNRRILRQALKNTDLDVLEAENGLQALDIAVELAPDVILLDVKMPDMDGYEVCRRLKDNSKTSAIPVLLVTAFADEEDRRMGLQAGADDFVAKPVDGPDLVLRIRNALAHRQEKERLQSAIEALQQHETLRSNMVQFAVNDINQEIGDLHKALKTIANRLTEPQNRKAQSEIMIIQDRLVNILGTTDHLLGLQRLETHESPFISDGCDLLAALDEVLELMNLEPGQNGFDVRIADDEVMVLADSNTLPKILRNLITVASEVIPEVQSQTLQIESNNLSVRMTIRAAGAGIMHTDHRLAFERLETFDSALNCHSSFELGLAFCKLAIEAQGGKLDLALDSDHSFTVEVTLPSYSATLATNVVDFHTIVPAIGEKQGMH